MAVLVKPRASIDEMDTYLERQTYLGKDSCFATSVGVPAIIDGTLSEVSDLWLSVFALWLVRDALFLLLAAAGMMACLSEGEKKQNETMETLAETVSVEDLSVDDEEKDDAAIVVVHTSPLHLADRGRGFYNE